MAAGFSPMPDAVAWLWRRLSATAPIRPFAWELPYAAEAALEKAKGQKKKKKKEKKMSLPFGLPSSHWALGIGILQQSDLLHWQAHLLNHKELRSPNINKTIL